MAFDKKKLISKLKSPVLWTGLIALVVEEALEISGVGIPGGPIVEWIITALIAVGIFNNPNDRKHI